MWTAILKIAGGSWGWITGNLRLMIEYALIATIVIIAGITATMWVDKLKTEVALAETRTDLESVLHTVDALEGTTERQGTEIVTLNGLRKVDSTALLELVSSMEALAKKDGNVRARLQHLEDTNDVVKAYMDTPLPADVACLHNDSCQAGDPDSEGNNHGIYRRASAISGTLLTADRKSPDAGNKRFK